MTTFYAVQRPDGKVWSHNGGELGDRVYRWLDELVRWTDSVGRPCAWTSHYGATLALKSLGGQVIEVTR